MGIGESGAGIMTTSGQVLFTADLSGNLMALDPENGNVLWHANAGARMTSSPMTYELDGRQYLVVSAGDLMLAFTLPDSLVHAGAGAAP